MPRPKRSHPKLQTIYKKLLEHETFKPIQDYDFTCVFSSVQLGDSAWADCTSIGSTTNSYLIRMNASLQLMNVPNYVLVYLMAHELVHALPGCWAHNDKFFTTETMVTGDNYYIANVWLKRHVHILDRAYQYRKKAWLERQIKDQLRIKDMAAICGCSISTIKRWLRKFDLNIVYVGED